MGFFIDGTESWCITVSSDDTLNFALYVGCLNGFIDKNELNKELLWPKKQKLEISSKTKALLKEQWNDWFNSLISIRGDEYLLNRDFNYSNKLYSTPKFTKFPYPELKEYCIASYKPFMDWWYMIGGGKNALSFYERLISNRVIQYVDEFEKAEQRKVKPFRLYIDLVYTGAKEIIEANDEYVVALPSKTIFPEKDWWTNKLKQIG